MYLIRKLTYPPNIIIKLMKNTILTYFNSLMRGKGYIPKMHFKSFRAIILYKNLGNIFSKEFLKE